MRHKMQCMPVFIALLVGFNLVAKAQDADFDLGFLDNEEPAGAVEGVAEDMAEDVEAVAEDMADGVEDAAEAALNAEVAALKEMPTKADKPADLEEMARQIAAQYEVKLQAEEEEGYQAFEKGYQALGSGDLAAAQESFLVALNKIPSADRNADYIERAPWCIAEAYSPTA